MAQKRLKLYIFIILCPLLAFGQEEQGPQEIQDNVVFEMGAHMGNILPNQVPGLTEITGIGGIRGAYRVAPFTFAETSFAAGNGYGAQWKDLSISVRADLPVENILGFVYIGPDLIIYQGTDRAQKLFGGGHAGGGMMMQLGGTTWFRFDMKFNVNPGTAMYISAGVVFRLGGDTGGGGN